MRAYNKKKKPKHKTKTKYRDPLGWGYAAISWFTKTISWYDQKFKDVGCR